MFSRWRRWLLIGVALLLTLLSGPVAWELYARWEARCELDATIAELDATDPRWRLEDVEADRRQVPPEENSARIVTAAYALLPKDWKPASLDVLDNLPPVFTLRPDEAKKLSNELDRARAALATARGLEDHPIGRYALQVTPDFMSTLVVDQMNSRDIVRLLDLDVGDAIQRRDLVKAWHSSRALLNGGRSLGDEPLMTSVLIRMAVDTIAIRGMERALAHGEMLSDHLQERQQTLQQETTVPLFLIGIRGERAGTDHLLTNIEAGKFGLMNFLENGGKANRQSSGAWWHGVSDFFTYATVLRSHTTLLDFHTRMVKAAQLPPDQRYPALTAIDAAIQQEVAPFYFTKGLARLLLPGVLKIAEAEQRVHTHLACAVTGLAAEQFRLRAGRWPNSLDALIDAGLLPQMPRDLFDGQPLRFRRTSDGLVIYAVGKNGTYDGTALDVPDHFDPGAIRVEFRLWDPICRRQSPAPSATATKPIDADTKPAPDESYTPPRGYLCYRAAGPIAVDGKLTDAAWKAAPWTEDFVDIEGDKRQRPRLRTRVKMLWDEQYFYIGAELQEPHLQASFTKHDSYIFHEDNDFEMFIDPDGSNHNYVELEMNALNTTWDLLLKKPYRNGGPAVDAFEIEGLKTAVHLDGTLNDPRDFDKGWTIEIALPWKALGNLSKRPVPPRDGAQWRVNFSRVEWLYEIVDGNYRRVQGRREDNWVWSPQGTVNMHRPERWGYVQFTTAPPGKAVFHSDPAGPAKHLLHRIYEAQTEFRKENERYAATLPELGLENVTLPSLAHAPRIVTRDGGYYATVDVRLPGGTSQRWRIREDSLLLPVTGDE